MPRNTVFTCLLLCTLMAACSEAAQELVNAIPEDVSCAACRIEVDTLLTIGDTTQAGMLSGRPMRVMQDGTGRYWISVLDAFPMIFDSTTSTLRTFGREGSGPGEFRRAYLQAVLPGDSMLVGDFRYLHVIAPDLTIARSIMDPTTSGRMAVIEWPRRVVAQANPWNERPQRFNTVMLALDLGADSAVVTDTLLTVPHHENETPADAHAGYRITGAPSAAGDLWITDFARYRLIRHDANGAAHDTIERTIPWFPPGQPQRLGGPGELASANMIDVWVDDGGLVWTLSAEPIDPGNAWQGISTAGEVRASSIPADYKLKRTLIEVIDPAERRVVARHTFDGYIFGSLPGNRVASYVETESGIPILTIYRITLRDMN